MSIAHIGNKNRLGQKLGKEQIEKMLKSRKWYKPSEDTKRKIIESNRYRFKLRTYRIYNRDNILTHEFNTTSFQKELNKLNLPSTFATAHRCNRIIRKGNYCGWYVVVL